MTAATSGPQAEVASGGGYTVTASYYLLGQLRQVREPLIGSSVHPRSGSDPSAGAVVYNDQTSQYDGAGRVTQVGDGNGLTTAYTYDAAGRLTRVTDALNQVTEYEYDGNGNRTRVWDALNPKGGSGSQATQFQYDELGRLLVTTDPTGSRTDLAYDAAGNLVSRTEGRHVGTSVYQTTQYAYDAGHRVKQTTYPNTTGKGPVTAVYAAYDGAGLRLFRRDDYGQAQYTYDVVGRLTRVVSPQENTAYAYDGVGNVKSVTSGLGTTAYAYDTAHRMTQVTDPLGNVTQYAYDGYGHLQTLTLPDGFQRQMAYYSLPSGAKTDWLQSISTARSTTTYWAGTYKYDYTGNVRSTDVNQVKTDLTPWTYALSADYDNLNRVTKWTDTSIVSPAPQNLFYTYDAVGNRTAWGNLNSNPTQNYQTPTVPAATVDQNTSYDRASRMTSQNTTLPQDWKQLTTAGGQVLYEANGNLLQTEYTTPPGAGTYAYSLNAYNDASQLVSHKTAVDVGGSPAGWSNTEEYSYDGDGRRIDWKNTSCPAGGGSCTTLYKQYEYVGSTAVAERQQDGHVSVWYVLGAGGEPLYTLHWDTATASLKPSIYAKDHLGSIRMVANSGGIANAYRYDAFVVPQVDKKTVANSIQGAGAPHDVPEMASGASTLFYPSLYNLRARLYDPLAGRFLTQDSYRGNRWQPWTQNLYAYVGNNPVNYIDPTGHDVDLPQGSSKDMDSQARLDFVTKFFREFSGLHWYNFIDRWQSQGLGYGKAVVDFMTWEKTSGRLDQSAWWNAVNGVMVDDMIEAVITHQAGVDSTDNDRANLWLNYMRHPSQASLWEAHNASIAAGFKANVDLLQNEAPAERQFAVYVTMRVLSLAPRIIANNSGPRSTNWPILTWIINGDGPFENFSYPQQYPAQYGTRSVDDPVWGFSG